VTPSLFRFEEVVVEGDGGARILDGVSVEVPDTGITVLAGPSGAGKSTLLRLGNRLQVPTAGRVSYRGDDIAGLDPLALRRRVGMVFQRPALFPGTVRDNLLVARPDGDAPTFAALLERCALPGAFLDRTADDLSGGEAQRACLARTLVNGPETLLMDEPTSSVDPATTTVLEDLARGLAGQGTPVVWVTHDLAQVARLADHRIVLVRGRVADGATAAAYLAGKGGPSNGSGRG